jgi:hypothetical protein
MIPEPPRAVEERCMISRLLWIMFVLAIAALVAAGCGGDDKPAYCSDVSDLQQSVDDLKNVRLTESGALSTLQTDLQTVQSNADAVDHDRAAALVPDGPAARSGRAGHQQCRDVCQGPRQRHQFGLRLTGAG